MSDTTTPTEPADPTLALQQAMLQALQAQTHLAERQIARLAELMAGTEPLSRAVQEQATAHTRAAASQISYENAMRAAQTESLRLQRVQLLAHIAGQLLADKTTATTSPPERERLFTQAWDEAVRIVGRADATYQPAAR